MLRPASANMSSSTAFATESTMITARRMRLMLALGLYAATLPGSLAHEGKPGAPGAAGSNALAACLDNTREAALRAHEVALLGGSHAAEHAQARLHRCRVMQGLEAEEAGPSQAALAAAATLRPDQAGKWSDPFVIPIAGISSVLLHTGKVLFWAYDPAHYHDPDNSNIGVSYVWDPATRTGHFVTAPENIWCGGQTILADGRVFLAGGNLRFPDPRAPEGQRGWKGDASTYIFNPATETFIRQPEMAHGRWYPTVTQLPDNSAIITSGYDESGSEAVNQLVERFIPSAGVNGIGLLSTVSSKPTAGLYPFQYVLPAGTMLQAGPERDNAWVLDPAFWSWTRLPRMRDDHLGNANGIVYTDASVTPVRQIVAVAGGKDDPSNNEWLDSYNPQSGWHDYPTWNQQRHNANTVILPDGTLLTVGGNNAHDEYSGTLFSAELYTAPADDLDGFWIEVAPHKVHAAYHSSAILLPDASVLLSEDDRTQTVEAAANHKFQLYWPPYLFNGQRPALSAPASVVRGAPIPIAVSFAPGRRIASAVLIAPGAVTHGNDMHQRFIKLPIKAEGTTLTATVPNSAALVPPGYYMLFVVDSAGVPSVATFVHLG
jgi:hypothetical protein